ncbi:MAG: acetyl-CoA acetyltransferase [Dehalococcoidia bacterium]|nr:MAG: acetyl-CoA acetyltransferase [Dehalococcoidia bacterium]
MESLKDKVAIVGIGCTSFGELWDKDPVDLIVDAAFEAFEDAGVEAKDIQAAWVGYTASDTAMTAIILSSALQLQFIPVTRVENACGTGAETIRGAALGLASKTYDLVLAVGWDKLKDTGFGGIGQAYPGKWHPVYGAAPEIGGAVARYALAATKYFSKYGLSPDEGKRLLAKISVKSHYNGSRNPKAWLRNTITVEQVLNAPLIAWPLGLLDCCGVNDGASAAVLCRTEDAKAFRPKGDYITIKASGIACGPGWGKERTDYEYTTWEETEAAAKQVYEMAGIKNPRKELSMAEVHDCFSIAELIAVESLGICEKGRAKEDIESGAWEQGGEIPINISGGLKSFGHPAGASGGREVYEFYKQFQGKAEEPSRQLKDVKLGLAHNQGGHPGNFVCGITIVGEPP